MNKRYNNFSNCEDYSIIYLIDGSTVLIDQDDLLKCNKYYWRYKDNNVFTIICNKQVSLSKFVLNCIDIPQYIKFINGNKKDCRKNNLSIYKSKNQIIEENNYYKIIVNDKNTIIFDKDDYDKASKYTWHIDKYSGGYAFTYDFTRNRKISFHRLIMNLLDDDENIQVDHISRNKLDNRKSNLRIVNAQINSTNRSRRNDNTSGITGVNFDKNANKWRVRISINKNRINLGLFDNFNEAVKMRMETEKKYGYLSNLGGEK